MKDIITQAVVALLDKERFYAELILAMDIKQNIQLPSYAGVCIKDRVQLHINPNLFGKLTLEEQVGILIHECKHILHDHIPRSKVYAPEVYNTKKGDTASDVIAQMKHKLLNVSMDLSINPGICGIPKNGMFPSRFKLPDNEIFEWYADRLKNNDQMKELTEYDGHELWSEGEGDKELLKEKIRSHVNEAAKRAKAAGALSSEEEYLISQLNESNVNWKAQLTRFVARHVATILDSSRKKRNRRYGILYPGHVKIERLTIGVARDTSGSISNEALAQFAAEISKISKYADVIVVDADCEVKTSYPFNKQQLMEVKGRGGTAYQPALDWFSNNEKVDAVIYFGDMDVFGEKITKPKYPVLWVIVGDQDPPVNWGSIIRINI